MKNELWVLKKENGRRLAGLSAENRMCIGRVHQHLNNARINLFEREITRKELIDKALEAEQHGGALIDVIGDETAFCTRLLADAAHANAVETVFDFIAYMKTFFLTYLMVGIVVAVFAVGVTGQFFFTFSTAFIVLGFPILLFFGDRFVRPISAFTGDWCGWRNLLYGGVVSAIILATLWLPRARGTCGVGFGLSVWVVLLICGGGWLLSELLCTRHNHWLAAQRGWKN